jgi:hypothetical protein
LGAVRLLDNKKKRRMAWNGSGKKGNPTQSEEKFEANVGPALVN